MTKDVVVAMFRGGIRIQHWTSVFSDGLYGYYGKCLARFWHLQHTGVVCLFVCLVGWMVCWLAGWLSTEH